LPASKGPRYCPRIATDHGKPDRPANPTGTDTERTDVSDVLVRSVELGILVVDARRRVVAFNEAAARLTRLSPAAVLEQPLDVLPAPLRSVIERTLSGAGPAASHTVVLEPDSARRSVLCANTSFWQVDGGQPASVMVVLQDLTSAQDLERRTGRLQRLASVGTLSAGVAHEIKNALVAIKSFADLLLEKGQDIEMASLVNREVSRIDSLVNQLLRFAGPGKAAFAPVQLHDSLRNCLRLIQHPLKVRKIELVESLEATADQVRGDAKQLEQAFINLLLNAIEAMGEGGQLLVHSEVVLATEHVSKFEPRLRQEQIQVSVRDTGAGVPPEILAALFRPFVTGKPGGTGLGLAITQRIISEHQGKILVDTVAGKGTTFRVILPLTRTPA
jgi:signal transduction histidine kinase